MVRRHCQFFPGYPGCIIVPESLSEGRRLVVGLSVPSRAYAAALLAAGFVAKRSAFPGQTFDLSEHFRQLCELPPRTSLFYWDGKRKYKALSEGTANINGSAMVKIRTEKNLLRYLPPALAEGVSISPVEFTSLPKHQGGRFVAPESPFFREFAGTNGQTTLILHSRLDCVLIGSGALLREEIVNTPLTFQPGKVGAIAGTLDCVLRVRRFSGATTIFRSDVLPVSAALDEDADRYSAAAATIFDGTASYMRWQTVCSRLVSVAILDRTETRFTEALDLFNQGYSMRVDDATIPNMPGVPREIEVAAYETVLL